MRESKQRNKKKKLKDAKHNLISFEFFDFQPFTMVKIYAISVFYKSTNDAKLLKSHYDLQSFSFFQRGESDISLLRD